MRQNCLDAPRTQRLGRQQIDGIFDDFSSAFDPQQMSIDEYNWIDSQVTSNTGRTIIEENRNFAMESAPSGQSVMKETSHDVPRLGPRLLVLVVPDQSGRLHRTHSPEWTK